MLGKMVYWVAVLVISLVLVVVLILFFEARDQSQVDERGAIIPGLSAEPRGGAARRRER